jgi:hypothetical protein
MAAHVGPLEGLFAGICSRSRVLSVHGAQGASASPHSLLRSARARPRLQRKVVCPLSSVVSLSEPARARAVMFLRPTRASEQVSWTRAPTSRLRPQRRPWPMPLNSSCMETGCAPSHNMCPSPDTQICRRRDGCSHCAVVSATVWRPAFSSLFCSICRGFSGCETRW